MMTGNIRTEDKELCGLCFETEAVDWHITAGKTCAACWKSAEETCPRIFKHIDEDGMDIYSGKRRLDVEQNGR